jgi:hypothetical protein
MERRCLSINYVPCCMFSKICIDSGWPLAGKLPKHFRAGCLDFILTRPYGGSCLSYLVWPEDAEGCCVVLSKRFDSCNFYLCILPEIRY